MTQETDRVRERYERRGQNAETQVWSDFTEPSVYLMAQEKERALVRWIRECGIRPVQQKRVIEVGCGGGSNLIDFLRMGFQSDNLVGNELLEDRARIARSVLPAATEVICGDATHLPADIGLFDVVYQSTVFTSLLDDAFQQTLAKRMWELVKPGGGVLWYDFTFDNPRNPDVRGVSLQRVHQLFPEGQMTSWRLTLAPPISRRVAKISPSLYGVFNLFPFLRTHRLCWIKKST